MDPKNSATKPQRQSSGIKRRVRSKEEIERDEAMKRVAIEKVGKIIASQWDNIKDADGPVHLELNVDAEAGTAMLSGHFVQKVEFDADMVLDDGQSQLPGTGSKMDGIGA